MGIRFGILLPLAAFLVFFLIGMPQAWSADDFSLVSSLQASSSLHRLDDPDRSADSSLTLVPAYALGSALTLGAQFEVVRDFTQGSADSSQTRLSDGSVKLSRENLRLNPSLFIKPSVTVLLPLSRASREQDSLITGVRPGLRLTPDMSRLGLKDLSAFYELGVSRYFHQYFVSTTGKSNTEYKISNRVNLSYSITKPLSISADLLRTTGWTYRGNPTNNFSLGEELSCDFSKAFSAAIGHSNEGAMVRDNGIDSNFAVTDGQGSRVYAQLTYTIE